MKYFALLFLFPFFLFSQIQIGQDIDGETPGDQSGWSVSLSSNGNILANGAPTAVSAKGQVRIFENQSGNWVQVGLSINGEGSGDQSGTSVSLSSDGSIIAIGAPRNDGNGSDSGHVRIYGNHSGNWVQIGGDIDGEAANNRFGTAVSISSDGSIVAVGAPFNSEGAGASGHVRILKNQSGNWVQLGQDIEGESGGDFSGSAVSLSSDGTVVAIAAVRNDGNGNDSGHVRVFENQAGTWVQIGQDIDGESAGNQSGSSISISSDKRRLAIGATFNNENGSNSGHVRVYENQAGNWVQIGLDINGENAGDLFGWSVDLSSEGNVLVSSGPANAGSRGYVKVYQDQAGSWIQVGQDVDGEAANNFSGRSVSLSSDGGEVAIGANRNRDNGNDSGHVRVYDLSSIILSLEKFILLSDIKFYPNPAKNHFTISFSEGLNLETITIYNHLGQYIFSSVETTINTTKLDSGIYFIQLEFTQGKVTKKLIVE